MIITSLDFRDPENKQANRISKKGNLAQCLFTSSSACLPSYTFLGTSPLLVLFNKRSASIHIGIPLVIVDLREIQQNQ
jgi:hypothetical protein